MDRLTIPDISIHTALAGCDQDDIAQEPEQTRFQSTQPSQAVTVLTNKRVVFVSKFQSTQPSQAVTQQHQGYIAG